MRRSTGSLALVAIAGAVGLMALYADAGSDANARPEAPDVAPQTVCLDLENTRREAYWTRALSKRMAGHTEHPVKHGRVDILTADHAIEVDWLHNFHVGSGQALYYSMETGKSPALAIVIRPEQMPLNSLDASKLATTEELTARLGIRMFVLYDTATCPAAASAQVALR